MKVTGTLTVQSSASFLYILENYAISVLISESCTRFTLEFQYK